ncbi:MAG: hypothetical protein U5M23_01325 [Marinagarivorans sp.]|nr:hypothetical protein [Marinagarivorans sp.]
MGFIAKVLSAIQREVKLDAGGDGILTAQQFATAGDDSRPLANDYAHAVQIRRTGRFSVLGFYDPKNAPRAAAGERIIYSRKAGDGSIAAEVWLKNDNSIILKNGGGSITLTASGAVNINGVIISSAGAVTVPSSIKVAGKELAGHTHAINSGSSAPGPTGPNL